MPDVERLPGGHDEIWTVGRRRLLTAAGGAALFAAAGTGFAPAATAAARTATGRDVHTSSGVPATAADYDELRRRWHAIVVGENIDPDDSRYTAAIADGDRLAETRLGQIDRSAGRRQVFVGQNFSSSTHLSNTYGFLRQIALSWATPGSRYEGDADVLVDIIDGLRLTHEVIYNERVEQFDNWFHWEIAAPRFMTDTLTLIYDHVDPADLETWLGAIDHFKPDPYYRNNGSLSTGANRVDMCRGIVMRGVLGRDDAKIGRSRDGLSDTFVYVTSGDGFYRDGSFVQHHNLAYPGTYGAVLLDGMSKLFALLAGSPWAVNDPNREVLYRGIEITFAPIIYDHQAMDFVCGRAVCRETAGDHYWAHQMSEYIIKLADGLAAEDPERADRWRATCKGWLARDTFHDPLSGAPVPRIAAYASVLDDPSVPAASEPDGFTLFPNMDRAVHRRPGWAYAISMSSRRISYYEHGNGENEWGFHTGEGMTYLYTSGADGGDNGQYSDAFWPTVDYSKLPGTTIDTAPLPRGIGEPWGGLVPDTDWVGGVSLGDIGAVGMDVDGIEAPLSGRKSWFCLDEYVVALGAGITDTSGHPVHTIVEHRNLHADGADALLLDGEAQPVEQGWQVEREVGWAHLAGVAGYVFPGDGPLTVQRHERTGAWADIRVGAGSSTPITRRWMTMWFDHGVDPQDATYAYILVPRATPERTAEIAGGDEVRIVENTGSAQAVEVDRLGVTAVNFWRPGTVGDLIAANPCSVILRRDGQNANGGMTLAVSDPTHRASGVRLTLRLEDARSWAWDADETIAVRAVRNGLHLTVDTRNAAGATHTIRLTAPGR